MKVVNIIFKIILFLLLIVMSPVIGLAIMIDVINDKQNLEDNNKKKEIYNNGK